MSIPLLRLITRLNVGGPAIQALLLSKALEPEYHTTLAAGKSSPEEGELSDSDVVVTPLPLVRPVSPMHDFRAIAQARSLLRSSGALLLHTHMAKAGAVGRAAVRTMRSDVRTVHTFHGHVLEGYFAPTTQRIFIEAERRLARRTDALIAVSSEVLDSLLDMGIGSPERFHVIPLGFDLDPFLSITEPKSFLRSELGIAHDVPLVGVVGRLAPIKDHQTLLHALVDVPGANLAVLGDGELRATLEAQAAALGLADRTHFLGWRRDVAECLSDMDVVALTSRNEGTPVSLIEASAAGRPVVATDVGGVRTVVIDGATGLLAPAGSAAHLAEALNRVLTTPDLAARLGELGREHVRDRFSKQRLVTDIRGLYADLLGHSV